MEFRIRDDIEIKSLSFRTNEIKSYNSEDIVRYVSYFLDEINNIKDLSKPIGVKLGEISFISACCMLALIKSGRDYGLIYYKNGTNRKSADVHFSHVFELGPLWDATDTTSILEYETRGYVYPIETDLTFRFSETQQIYALPVESEELEILTRTGKIEEHATKAAMEHYFSEDDYCVFTRPLRHVGVATLCVYPALFKAKGIAFCGNRGDWDKLYHLATHVHMSHDMMIDKFPLPNKLRMLTTGGYDFNKDFIEYVHSQCEIENIVDCYGTRHCPPPLAIRHLVLTEYSIPFKWINEYIKPNFKNNWLRLVSADDFTFKGINDYPDRKIWNEYLTIDSVFPLDDNTFHLIDLSKLYENQQESFKKGKTNIISNIRMHHQTYSDINFIDYADQNSNTNLKLAFHYMDGHYNPKILVNANEVDSAVKFLKNHAVEAVLYVKHDD